MPPPPAVPAALGSGVTALSTGFFVLQASGIAISRAIHDDRRQPNLNPSFPTRRV
jgi:hypothetical protein